MLFVTSRLRPFIKGMPGMILLTLLACFSFINGFSQCPITQSETCGAEYELTLTLTGSNTATNWDIVAYPAGITNLSQLGLTKTIVNNKTCKIHGVPKVNGPYTLVIKPSCDVMSPACISCPGGCSPCDAHSFTTNVFMQPHIPVDVMLVLDVSGSMETPVPPGTATSRYDVLKQAVQAFLIAYRNFGACNYQVGVTYFDHSRGDFSGGGLKMFNGTPPIPLTGAGSIQDDMGVKFTKGATSLGGGMLAGYSAFTNPLRVSRNMIVFTDGIQNTDPTVDDVDMIIKDPSPPNTNFPPAPLDLKAPANPFRTFVISIGDQSSSSLLSKIGIAPTNNNYDAVSYPISTTTGLITTLPAHFDAAFVDALDEFSPQLVDIRTINVTNSASTQFVVNPSADKVMIKVVADPGQMSEARIKIEKDGKDLSHLLTKGGSTFSTFFIDSTLVKRYRVALAGVFKVSILGPSGKYQVTCMINDEFLEARAKLGKSDYAPGDSIELEASLRYDTLSLAKAKRATVLIAKPGEDVNDLFSHAGSIDIPDGFPGEKDNDPGQRKYDALLALNPAFAASLQPKADSINLTDNGNGKYTAVFGDTKESGIYNFVFKLAGTDSLAGSYERFILLPTVIDFGTADPSKTIFQIVDLNGKLFFQLTPKNKFDHFIGPNRLRQIKILVDGKTIALTDKLDGTYEAEVPARSFPNLDPKVEVDIKGDDFIMMITPE